ncbi:hypothetical protein JCM8115_004755 [Rhodotorula mucilaginosa]
MDLPPPPASWAPPSVDFVCSALPSLPPIQDPELARQARTMKSSLSLDADGTEKRELRAAELGSNERLEWRGDVALHFYISDRLQAVVPRATVGELSDLRGRLTSNRTFSHLSWHYGIPRELIFSQRDSNCRSSREEDQRIAANAFEAHWGALFASGDASLMLDWLDQFLKPTVIPALDHIEKTIDTEYDGTSGVPQKRPRLETGDPVRDAEHRTSSGRRTVTERSNHKWIDEFKPGQRWCSTLEIGGQVVGMGTGNKIISAREVALEQWIETVLPSSSRG